MTEKGKHWLRRRTTWILLGSSVVGLGIYCGVRIIPVIRLEKSMERPLEIYFNQSPKNKYGRPELMNEDIDQFFGRIGRDWAENVFGWRGAKGNNKLFAGTFSGFGPFHSHS